MKTLFIFNIENTIDVITNSSSELFIFKGNTIDDVKNLIKKAYPDYLNEYQEVVHINDLSEKDLDTYLSYHVQSDRFFSSDERKPDFSLANHFKIEPEIMYSNFKTAYSEKWWWPEISKAGYKHIRQSLPKNIYFLFSIGENPNFDRQEDLDAVAARKYHLG